ncbi:ubiquitin carboxyl-terminal hydrolase 18-like [Typha latifolia]|uniref:ubiquitin carboxyl-terminal hydrolase 18-like n=1 Tax=Typha latifolia TaxID=4733 RepID=UPI003C30452B
MLGAAIDALDLSALLQLVVVALLLLSAALLVVKRAASRYFDVDTSFEAAAGAGAGYEEFRRPMSIGGDDGSAGVCASCGHSGTKKCSGCKRVRYCSRACQSKHWEADHRLKCKQMRLSEKAEFISLGNSTHNEKPSGFGPISLVPANKRGNKVLFSYDEFLKLFNWDNPGFPPCGLLNCGNSCFANVVLQCLACTRPLVAYLLEKDHNRGCVRKQEDWCFLCELQVHVQRASKSLHPFSPINILSRLPNIGGNLGYGRQEDAHEFMRFAIEKMQSACLDEFGGEKSLDPSTQETTLIQHIFGGHLQSQVKCTKCKMISNRYENMMDLTVEIQGNAESLEECLDQFTAGEWLDGENKYKCDGCNDYVKALKRLTVHQAPNILTIALKRFQSGRFGKLNKRVTFPENLDLTPYMSGNGDGNDLYTLYAVVVHVDMLNASFFGHYICYTKDYHGRWYRIDDCKVMLVEVEEVLAQGAYMLLYSRKTARERPLIMPSEPLKKQKSDDVVLSSSTPRVTSPIKDSSLPLNIERQSNFVEDPMLMDTGPERKLLINGDVIKVKEMNEMDLDMPIKVEPLTMPKDLENDNVDDPLVSRPKDHEEEGDAIANSMHWSSLPEELSSVSTSTMQCQEPSVSSDSNGYVEVGKQSSRLTEAPNLPQHRRDQSVIGQQIVQSSLVAPPATSYLVLRPSDDLQPELEQSVSACCPSYSANEVNTPLPGSLENIGSKGPSLGIKNGLVGKSTEFLPRGFLDKPSKMKSLNGERTQFRSYQGALSPKANGLCNGHSYSSVMEQEICNDSASSSPSIASRSKNATMVSTSSVGTSSSGNCHDTTILGPSSENGENGCEILQGDLSFISRGFLTKSYGESLHKDKSRSRVHNCKPNGNESAKKTPDYPKLIEDWRLETPHLNCRSTDTNYKEFILDNGRGNGYHAKDDPVMMVFENSSSSGKDDHLKSVSCSPIEHSGLRHRSISSSFADHD